MSTQSPTVLQAEVDRLRDELQVMKGEQKPPNISIGNYILTRLTQLGATVSSIACCCSIILSFTLCDASLCSAFPVISISGFW